jgi:SAM-dependent methyltransferase
MRAVSTVSQSSGRVTEPSSDRPHLPPARALQNSVTRALFPEGLSLVPGLNEVYELELALCESQVLTDDELLRNGAYFASVNGRPTNHFLMCRGEPLRLAEHSSSRLKSFFQDKQFKTGYATHGLFPYRGKFHPQMIKALLNVMGLKPGETVLDPMMGSGTVAIEARLMGIHSVGIDASPFCVFMSKVKADALTVPVGALHEALECYEDVFRYFNAKRPPTGKRDSRSPQTHRPADLSKWSETELVKPLRKSDSSESAPELVLNDRVRDFLLLAYLDSAGYAERSKRTSHLVQFKSILDRYVFVVEKIQTVLAGEENMLGNAKFSTGDARSLELHSDSVDGILFSPPYSFALDYIANDAFHLRYLGIDSDKLRSNMVGLSGKSPREKVENYRRDMEAILGECHRVLKPGRLCTIVVGTNNNQIGRALGLPSEEVEGIDTFLTESGKRKGLRPLRKFTRQITGMANTLRTESILVLGKE